MPTTLCTMRTLQVRETMTILKVDFPVDARIRPFVPPTRKRDSASLRSNRRRPLDTPTSPGDQTSGFLMRCKTMPHAMLMHSRPIAQSSDHAVPECRTTLCRRALALKKPWPKKLWAPTTVTEIRK